MGTRHSNFPVSRQFGQRQTRPTVHGSSASAVFALTRQYTNRPPRVPVAVHQLADRCATVDIPTMVDAIYDLVVIGSGPGGEKGVAQAAYFGKKGALIEQPPRLGGAVANTGVPGKTQLR